MASALKRTLGTGELSPGVKRARQWDEPPKDHRVCHVCEEDFTEGVDGMDCCCGQSDELHPVTDEVVIKGHQPVSICSACIAKWFLTSRRYPQCNDCASVFPEYDAVYASCPEVRALPQSVREEMEHAHHALEHIHRARCPSCGTIGSAHGNGTVEIHNIKPVLCWRTDGSRATNPSMNHPLLCEECLGPLQWCFCDAPRKAYHLNHYFRDMNCKDTFLTRNHYITEAMVKSFVFWLMTFDEGRLPAVCPGCRRLISRADNQCHELGCCGYKICFFCGFADRGPNLLDHYQGAGGSCVQFPQSLRIHGKQYPCTDACQSIKGGDCTDPAHREWHEQYDNVRRRTWLMRFIDSLSPKRLPVVEQTLNRIFFPSKPISRFPESYVLAGTPLSSPGWRRCCSVVLFEDAATAIRRVNDRLAR
jgi:hypothetical protein